MGGREGDVPSVKEGNCYPVTVENVRRMVIDNIWAAVKPKPLCTSYVALVRTNGLAIIREYARALFTGVRVTDAKVCLI